MYFEFKIILCTLGLRYISDNISLRLFSTKLLSTIMKSNKMKTIENRPKTKWKGNTSSKNPKILWVHMTSVTH